MAPMMPEEIWFTADQHFDHANVIRHSNRPWATIDEMNTQLYANWNAMVKGRDVVYILGDFAWKNHMKHLARLNGKKILITGTHDKMPLISLKQFTKVIGGNKTPGVLELVIDKQPVTMSHYPLLSWNGSSYGSWMLHGHSHGRIPEFDDLLRCDVGVDVWQYAPVPWAVIKQKMTSRILNWKNKRRTSADPGEPAIQRPDRVAQLSMENAKWRQNDTNQHVA